jgi:hypothetical protein
MSRVWRFRLAGAMAVLALMGFSVWWWGFARGDSVDRQSGDQARAAPGTSAFDAALASIAGMPGNPPAAARPGDSARKRLTAKEMLLSNDPGLIDYGGMTTSLDCLSIRTTEDVWMQDAEATLAESKAKGSVSAGLASLATRLKAFRRSREVCGAFYPDGQPDDEFYRLMRATKGHERVRAIRNKLDTADLASSEGKAVFNEAMTAPMYSAIKTFVFYRMDVARFEGMFPAHASWDLVWYAAEVLTCKMGDDCGADSPKALQLCWNAGICGGDVETAYRTHMRSAGMDADQFSRLVTELHGRLQQGDTTWLKSRLSPTK